MACIIKCTNPNWRSASNRFSLICTLTLAELELLGLDVQLEELKLVKHQFKELQRVQLQWEEIHLLTS